MDIPEEARMKLQELLDKKYPQIIAQNAIDIGRTNLIKLDIPTEGLIIASKPYTVLIKYLKFIDHEIKQLQEADIISQSMSDWASPMLMVPKKEDLMETNIPQGSSNFNLQQCIDYRKLNSCIQMACHNKADGSLGKVIFNSPLPTIDSILAHFNSCKYFSTINLRSGYYHITLSKEVAEKTAFVTNKGKWIVHSPHFSINICPFTFSYILGKVLAQCLDYTVNYLNEIMVFSEMWESHLKHLKEVFKWLQDVDLKIKCGKCEFFKNKVHYLGYLVGTDSVQSLPEKVAAVEALEPPQNIEELWHFLGLIRFYSKFIPFFTNITACLNTMLRKGVVFKWTKQCNNAFNLLKTDLVKMPRLHYPNPNKTFKLFTDATKHSYSDILHQEEVPEEANMVPNLVLIAYFSGSSSKKQQLWNTAQKECYAV